MPITSLTRLCLVGGQRPTKQEGDARARVGVGRLVGDGLEGASECANSGDDQGADGRRRYCGCADRRVLDAHGRDHPGAAAVQPTQVSRPRAPSGGGSSWSGTGRGTRGDS